MTSRFFSNSISYHYPTSSLISYLSACGIELFLLEHPTPLPTISTCNTLVLFDGSHSSPEIQGSKAKADYCYQSNQDEER